MIGVANFLLYGKHQPRSVTTAVRFDDSVPNANQSKAFNRLGHAEADVTEVLVMAIEHYLCRADGQDGVNTIDRKKSSRSPNRFFS